MMLVFMRYELLASILIAFAAFGIDQLCSALRLPRRACWTLGLVLALVGPLAIALTTHPVDGVAIDKIAIQQSYALPAKTPSASSEHSVQPPISAPHIPIASAPAPSKMGVTFLTALPLDVPLTMVWLVASASLLIYYAILWRRLTVRAAGFPLHRIQGTLVSVTEDLGPAVFGWVRPRILIPRWLLSQPDAVQKWVILHEAEHLAARDPMVLFVGLLAVGLMPWNPVLWWMLRRLQFSLEVDCDSRVLKDRPTPTPYAEALLEIYQYRSSVSAGSMILPASRSWLERRVRLMSAIAGRLRSLLTISGSVCAISGIAGVMLLNAPGLASSAASKGGFGELPPYIGRPAESLVRRIAKERFPEIYSPGYRGLARIVLVLNQDGSIVAARKQEYRSEDLPPMSAMRLGAPWVGALWGTPIDVSDVLAVDGVEIVPSGPQSNGPGRGYIVYAILKWPHDPNRSEMRVREAVEAAYPALFGPQSQDGSNCLNDIAVVMNDNGSVREAHRKLLGCAGEGIALGKEEPAIDDFHIPQKERGRSGVISLYTPADIRVHFQWPRHADDAQDVDSLSMGHVPGSVWLAAPPEQNTLNERALMARYFAAVLEQDGGRMKRTADGRYLMQPWILFGRDGRVWDTGLFPALINSNGTYFTGKALQRSIEARFPGIRLETPLGTQIRFRNLNVLPFWISADSPIQRKEDLQVRNRGDLLVTAYYTQDVQGANSETRRPAMPFERSFARALTFGIPQSIEVGQDLREQSGEVTAPVSMQVIAQQISPDTVELELQTRSDLTDALIHMPTQDWARGKPVRLRYGDSIAVELFYTDVTPAAKVIVILRADKLRDRSSALPH